MWFKKNFSPVVIFDGITAEVEKDWSHIRWKFNYKDVAFYTEGHILEIPTIESLDKYLSWINNNKKQIQESTSEVLERWGGTVDSAIIGGITIQNKNKISVLFVGDEKLGDMGGDFVFENGVIVDEAWGD